MENSTSTDVWYLIGSLQIGGTNRTLVDLVNTMDPEKYNVTIWTLLEPGELAGELNTHVALRSLDAQNTYNISSLLPFVTSFLKKKPDILQSFLFFDNQLARLVSVFSPSTTVICGVRAVPDEPSYIRKFVDSVTMPLADVVVSNSEAGAELAIDRGADVKAVHVIHNGRKLSPYQDAIASSNLYINLGIPVDTTVIGTIGRLIYRKGHHDLLRAFAQVQTEYPETHLLLVGDGPRRNVLKTLADDLGIATSVTFAGTRTNIPELLALMDYFIFPSHFEGLPGALQEAMIAGLPIVTTPVNGNSELVTDGETGVFVPPETPNALARALSQLLEDREFAAELGTCAAADAADRFSVERMSTAFDNLYQSIEM
jgi:glycosyltransferase involved in cell wall biosynthesis